MKRVLIVDDKEENLYYLKALLTGHGYEVDAARHGAEALTKARQNAPDVVISDLLMPVMDGYTLLRHWRADSRLGSIPFIVYTATYTEPEDERLALSLGADLFILKPAEPDEFLARVREVADSRPSYPRPATAHPFANESEMLRVYSQALIRKLEEKTLQLQEANDRLERDIAERKRVEESLRDSEERFRATFEQAAVGIAHVSVEGRFLWANQKLCEMAGYARDRILQLGISDLTAPEDLPEQQKAMATLLSGEKSEHALEKRFRRSDGDFLWASIVTKLLRDADGAPKYFISVIVDISDRKILEEQLIRAQRMESIGTLAGGIAHDLNNILAPILMGVEMLAPLATDDYARYLIDTIASSAARGRDMVRQVLSFARGVEGARVAVHLKHILREIESIVSTTFPKNIALQTAVAKDLSLVSGDPTQLTQIVLNLCVNARDAMPNGGAISVSVRNVQIDEQFAAMHRAAGAGSYVLLEVADTGTGISPAIVNRIFEPFFTTKDVGKGTGLGLSTVLGIARSHGGFVDVRSELGNGSTFAVYLPVLAEPEAAPVSGHEPAVLPRGSGEVVMVVDDDQPTRDILARTLEKFGYRTLAAEDGAHAVSVFALHRPRVDIVITDMMMPVMDGPALVNALRRIEPAIPIIASSGLNGDGDAARAAACGVNHVLPKPFSAEALLTLVRTVLSTRGHA